MDGRGGARLRDRVDALDGVRGLSALAILVFHGYVFSPGQVGSYTDDLFAPFKMGVVVFFAVSGFLLYRPFAAAALRGEKVPSLRRYARNRILRIVPAYWVVLFACSTLGCTVVAISGAHTMLGSLSPRELVLDASLVSSLMPSRMLTGLTPAWTLAIEATFYVVLPVLGATICRLAHTTASQVSRRRLAYTPPLALLLLGLGGQVATQTGDAGDWGSAHWSGVLDRSFVCNACLFSGGMVVAVLHADPAGRPELPRVLARARRLLVVGAIPIIFAGRIWLPWWAYIDAVSLLASALVLQLAFATTPALLTRTLTTTAARGLGAISYGIYLWNFPVMLFLASHQLLTPGPLGVLRNVILSSAITLPAAAATYLVVERPILAFKGRRPAPPVPGTALPPDTRPAPTAAVREAA
jgi:peptidoglycan/LPS O-acetylase OafA/YrhL